MNEDFKHIQMFKFVSQFSESGKEVLDLYNNYDPIQIIQLYGLRRLNYINGIEEKEES